MKIHQSMGDFHGTFWFAVRHSKRERGTIGSLLGRRGKGLSPKAPRIVHRALSGAPEISEVRWHFKKDFDVLREELGTAEPSVVGEGQGLFNRRGHGGRRI